MATVLISLGSNVGDRAAAIRTALDRLAASGGVRVTASSSLHETKPAGGPQSQENFLNAAALLETNLPPLELLSVLQKIENELGRVRDQRWGSRTIDMDLLLYDQIELETPELTLPHPRMSFRRFVLEPAAEIAAEMVHPVCGNTIGGLLQHLEFSPRWIFVTDAARVDIPELFADCNMIYTVQADVFPQARNSSDKQQLVERVWSLGNNLLLFSALNAAVLGTWVVSDWWESVEHWRQPETRFRLQFEEVLRPQLLIIADNRIDDLKCFLREHYRGPMLWIDGCSPDQLRDEVLAAIAAME